MSYALITGASKGIGKAIAFDLAARGYNLLLAARSEELLQQVSTAIKKNHAVQIHCLPIDLSAADAAQSLFNWTTENGFPISILVNNAGYGLSGLFESHPLDKHLNMVQLNCTTLVQLTYLFLPALKQQKEAHILNISSSAAYQAVPYLSLYAASNRLCLVSPGACGMNYGKHQLMSPVYVPGLPIPILAPGHKLARKPERLLKN
jgi:short-subunit dehydrogenase